MDWTRYLFVERIDVWGGDLLVPIDFVRGEEWGDGLMEGGTEGMSFYCLLIDIL